MASSELYSSRPGPRTIRLLELVSAPDADIPEYKLREHCLDDKLSFEALSYVWGDPAVCEELTIDGKKVAITVNLRHALTQLSYRHEHPPLWADAICINQTDLAEREEQAALVGEIYSSAAHVLAWLGPDSDGECSEAPGLVKLIYTECERMAKDRGEDLVPFAHKLAQQAEDEAFLDVSVSQVQKAMEEAKVPESAWQCLRRLFDSRWFTRIWCLQEINLARSGLLILGGMEPIPWEWLAVTAVWYKVHLLNSSDPPEMINGVMYYYALYMFMGVGVSGHDGAEALVAALWRFHPFQSTDPRDKVYALLGLLWDSDVKIPDEVQVRYVDTTVADVYTSVAMALINERKDLKILAWIKHTSARVESELEDNMPSWVPRWDGGPGLSMLHRNFKPGVVTTASGEHIYAEISPSPPKTLNLKGLSFGKVDIASRLMHKDLFRMRDDIESETHSGLGLFIDLWNFATGDDAAEGALEKLARTLTADHHGRGLEKPSDEEKEQAFVDFLGWMSVVFNVRGVSQPKNGAPPIERLAGRNANPGRFAKQVGDACHGRRIFWAYSGFLGLGPPGMEGEHEVVVVKGGATPYVLKPKDDGWLFLGESYVDGIMFGECFAGEVKGWEKPDEKDFLLI